MSEHFNKLTPAEQERLALLLEEMGEAQQIIGKILRHGYESHNPFDPNKITNRKLLEKELGDVMCAMGIMCEANDIDDKGIRERTDQKLESVWKWLHHQGVK